MILLCMSLLILITGVYALRKNRIYLGIILWVIALVGGIYSGGYFVIQKILFDRVDISYIIQTTDWAYVFNIAHVILLLFFMICFITVVSSCAVSARERSVRNFGKSPRRLFWSVKTFSGQDYRDLFLRLCRLRD